MSTDMFWVILSIVAFVVFWGLVIGGVILVARAVTRRDATSATPPRDPAIDALRTRYARGEIDDAEFERLRSSLQRH